MALPPDILARVERVLAYHRASKYESGQPKHQPQADPQARPVTHRIYDRAAKVPLSTTLLDAPVAAIAIMERGREALPDSQISPPQDLKTLSTWLFMSDGMIPIYRQNKIVGYERTCPSAAGTCPCELYVAAFAIDGLESGLYHFSAREYALRKLREGNEALALLKRGRPDLEFLKTTPGVILVSSVFSRSAWKFGMLGYRQALRDAGQLMENVSISGNALGIQTITRMRLTESTSRELIGVAPDAPFDEAESVQAMIIWADPAAKPMASTVGRPVVEHLPAIPRPTAAKHMQPFNQIVDAHNDCVAPGVAVREIRPPLTELTPMGADAVLVEKPMGDDAPIGQAVFRTLTTRRAAVNFHRRSIPRNAFLAMNRAAFQGGSHFPLFPEGPHVALVRPFWFIHSVGGVDAGVWYYHPPNDMWVNLDRDDHRLDSAYLAYEQPMVGNSAAVCFMFANLNILMTHGGPDLYRLAHLEAGAVAQRLYIAANSLGLGCAPIGEFYDNEVRKFLGMERTGWEPLHAVAIGVSSDDRIAAPATHPVESDSWRD
jgi:SagB-type dehydrogenase family enzyme